MAIEQRYHDLINADIDGEISDVEKNELREFLDASPEGRALHGELSSLCASLDDVEEEDPPPYLRHVIMNSLHPAPTRSSEESPGFLQVLFATPALKYAAMFAAGVFLTLSIVNSSQISNQAFDDVTELVGSVAEPVTGRIAGSISLDEVNIAGNVFLRSAGPLLILDFDLVSEDPIEVQADYARDSIWFNGFAQLENEGTTIQAESGRVRLGMEGKRRYAVYLYNRRGQETTVRLKFLADGQVIHEADLEYRPSD